MFNKNYNKKLLLINNLTKLLKNNIFFNPITLENDI